MKELANKIADAMGTADHATWTKLDALLTLLEKGNMAPALRWSETGEFLEAAPAQKVTKARRPLDLAAPHTSIVLNVPFARKDEAKAAGAKWHPTRKFWYFPATANTEIPEAIKQFIA